jgi:hypothetical protein
VSDEQPDAADEVVDDPWRRDAVVMRASTLRNLGAVELIFLAVLVIASLGTGPFRIFFVLMLAAFVATLAYAWWRSSSWSLVISDAGIERRMATYRVRIPWRDVTGLRRDRNGMLAASWTLEHRDQRIEGLDGGEPSIEALEQAATRKAGSRLLLDAFTRDPMSSVLGVALARHRPDLVGGG